MGSHALGSLALTCLFLSCGLDRISICAAKPRALVFLGCTGICRQSWQSHVLESAGSCAEGEQGKGLRKAGQAACIRAVLL